LLATSAAAFEIVKWIGAAYLLYLGVKLLAGSARERPALGARPLLPPAPAWKILREGFVINVFNPKVALFFLAFLPQFISADAPAKALSFVLLGCLFNFNSLFVNLPVAWLASRAGRSFRESARAARWLTGAVGALFVLLAARLATLERT
jgi:threonine/homoserine/homoserine lactone efflux protein